MVSGFIINDRPAQKEISEFNIQNNVISSSEIFGWVVPHSDCDQDSGFLNNAAHSSDHCFWFFRNVTNCMSQKFLTAYKCKEGVIAYESNWKSEA